MRDRPDRVGLHGLAPARIGSDPGGLLPDIIIVIGGADDAEEAIVLYNTLQHLGRVVQHLTPDAGVCNASASATRVSTPAWVRL